MALITVCDLCEKQKPFDVEAVEGEDYCSACASVVARHESAGWAQASKKYDAAIVNQVSVVGLLENLADNHPSDFKKLYGTSGIKMLNSALGRST